MDSSERSAAMAPPRVVACMPTWNAESFLEQTLESLAAQTYPHLDILISDDASTDRTPEICARFAANHPRCRLMRQELRRGWTGNVTRLLQVAEGDYLFFAFHDDPLSPTYVERLVEALWANPRAVLAFSDIATGGETRSYRELEGVDERVERGRRMIWKNGAWWIPNRGLFRADAGKRVGGVYRHSGGEYSADWPWLLHLALLGEFVRVPEPLVRKAWRKEGLSHSWRGTLRQKLGVTLSCMREVRRAGLRASEEFALHREIVVHGLAALRADAREAGPRGR
ncbi:MAG: glycosyltransferase family 2 protein [Casimicrobiaceae bacterium]